jgi:hypothetical protein
MRTVAAVVAAFTLASCTSVDENAQLFQPREYPDAAPDAYPLLPTFESLEINVFRRKCTAACHSGGMFAAGNFDMSGDTVASMVNVPAVGTETSGCGESGFLRILPGIPKRSLVYLKLMEKSYGFPDVCGEGMPQGANRDPLSDEEIAAIAEWISLGAPP